MNNNEIVKTLGVKYGTIELGRHYLREMRKNLSTIKIGIAENNSTLMAKDVELLAQNIECLSLMFADEQMKKEIKNLKKTLAE